MTEPAVPRVLQTQDLELDPLCWYVDNSESFIKPLFVAWNWSGSFISLCVLPNPQEFELLILAPLVHSVSLLGILLEVLHKTMRVTNSESNSNQTISRHLVTNTSYYFY